MAGRPRHRQVRMADEGLAQIGETSGGRRRGRRGSSTVFRHGFPVVTSQSAVRLGVDIGGTFTDVALEVGERRYTAKGLTTPRAPEEGVLAILRTIVGEAGIQPADVDLIIHGTTLATNALIERKGAKTALLTTEGFRDVVEIRHENRFEQYDVNIDLPPPLVPRRSAAADAASASTRKGDVLIAARRGERRARDRRAARRKRSRRWRSGFCTASPIPTTSAASAQAVAAAHARVCRHAVLRRFAGDARIRALLDRLRQCLCAAADGELSHQA